MNTALHDCISLANSPCVGVCSTSMAPFDEQCKGCGRTVDQIRDWETYRDFDKKLINVQNWLEGFNIRQKRDRIKNMAEHSDEKLQDIKGQLLTIQSLIENDGPRYIRLLWQRSICKRCVSISCSIKRRNIKNKTNSSSFKLI
jgi:predicted Fe-S protein YdhL (DUF1289 family)